LKRVVLGLGGKVFSVNLNELTDNFSKVKLSYFYGYRGHFQTFSRARKKASEKIFFGEIFNFRALAAELPVIGDTRQGYQTSSLDEYYRMTT
jgi:hypothetical protein